MSTILPYGHDSDVGQVLDVAHFSRFKVVQMAVVAVIFAGLIGVAAAYCWNPKWFITHPSKAWADAQREVINLQRDHPLARNIGVSVAAGFSVLCLVGAVSLVASAVKSDYYFRVGEGGVSMRVPGALFAVFERDIPWSDIETFSVVQEKRFGALSRNAGNLGGQLNLRLRGESTQVIRLDCFREDAWLIHRRIEDAAETRPTVLSAE